MAKGFYASIDTANNEYMSVYTDEGKVVVHVGYYEATLNNKQVDELVKALKAAKVNKK